MIRNAKPQTNAAASSVARGTSTEARIFLDYVRDGELRRRIQLQLNRGEARHDLARVLFFAKLGEFSAGDYEEIMNKASCLSLLSNAVLVWNTVQIERIVSRLRAAGAAINDEDLARISPLMRAHVIPNGTYHFRSANAGVTPA